MKQSFREEDIRFRSHKVDYTFSNPSQYSIHHLDQLLGVVSLNKYLGTITFTIDGESHDIPSNRGIMMSMNDDEIITAIKSNIIDIYNNAKQYLFEDALKFTRRDPSIIGNGLHDYDVHHHSKLLGTIMFPTLYTNVISQNISGSHIVFAVNGEIYNTGVTIEQVSNLSSKEIFDIMRPNIIHIIEKNKISYN